MPHPDSPARPPRPAASRRCGRGSATPGAGLTAGSVSRGRAATDPPNRRPVQARSRARAARTASLQTGWRIRSRRSGPAAGQGPRSARDPARPQTPPRRARLSRGAHPQACHSYVDHDLGRYLHHAPGQRCPFDQRRRVDQAVATPIDYPPIRPDLCHARHCRAVDAWLRDIALESSCPHRSVPLVGGSAAPPNTLVRKWSQPGTCCGW